MKKSVCMCLALVILMLPFAVSASSINQGNHLLAIVNNPNPADRLNLRSAPSVGAQSIAKYFNGTYVNVISTYDTDWVYVVIGNTNGGSASGYMSSAYLTFDLTNASISPALPVLTIRNRYGQGLNLRTGWDAESEQNPSTIIGLFPNGTQVMALGVLENWYHVQIGGMTGYMRAFGFSTDLGGSGMAAPPSAPQDQPTGSTTVSTGYHLFRDNKTIQDDYGYTVTASVTESVQGYYLIAVTLSLNGMMSNSTLIGYNAYADGSYLGYLEAKGRVGNHPDGAPVYFEYSFSSADAISQIELRPLWSRSGQKADGTENTNPMNYVVLTRR